MADLRTALDALDHIRALATRQPRTPEEADAILRAIADHIRNATKGA